MTDWTIVSDIAVELMKALSVLGIAGIAWTLAIKVVKKVDDILK